MLSTAFSYHLWKLRLHRQPSARAEALVHIVRAFSFALALGVLDHVRPEGASYWALAALFAVELLDDVMDVLIEPASRAPLSGLPPTEYPIHMMVMALSGGVWVSFLLAGWKG